MICSLELQKIQGGFTKTGIWLFSLPTVLNMITYWPETPSNNKDEPTKPSPTLMTSKSIHWAQKAYKANPTKANLNIIL